MEFKTAATSQDDRIILTTRWERERLYRLKTEVLK
jgi:hypothetical protein